MQIFTVMSGTLDGYTPIGTAYDLKSAEALLRTHHTEMCGSDDHLFHEDAQVEELNDGHWRRPHTPIWIRIYTNNAFMAWAITESEVVGQEPT